MLFCAVCAIVLGQQTNICRLIWNVFFITQDKSLAWLSFLEKPKAVYITLYRENC